MAMDVGASSCVIADIHRLTDNGAMADWDIEQATTLFARFAEKHRLKYAVEPDAPVELLWTFPIQGRLSMPVTLGLQNGDELNFGVADFWSSFFPFEEIVAQFERVLDAWVAGDARIVFVRLGGRALQLRDGGVWRTIYRANCLLPVPQNPRRTISNQQA